MELRNAVIRWISANVRPSSYGFILAPYDRSKLDMLASTSVFPHVGELVDALFYAAMFGVLRLLLTYLVMKPLAISSMKIKFKRQQRVSSIDAFIARSGPIAAIQSTAVSEFCRDKSNAGLSESTVAAYIWNVRHDKASSKKVTKFVEALWRFLFYSYFCYLGYRALFTPTTASWVQDTAEHWRGWPMQPVPAAVRFYYNIELGAYLHQLMWTEVSRSDSLEMIVHHLVTSALITFSYLTSFTRIGASILLLHDSADIFLESAKVVNYISKASGNGSLSVYCDGLFAAFALTFFVTRLVLYPRYLVYSLLYEAPAILGGTWPGYWVFATLLVVLQLLHVFWFYLIMRMIVGLLSQGNVEKDVRSDDEADLADDHDPSAKNSSGSGSGSSPPKKIATKKSKKADESVGSGGGGADAAGTSSSGSRAKNGGDSKKGSESKKAASSSSSSSSSSGGGADRLLRSSKKSKG